MPLPNRVTALKQFFETLAPDSIASLAMLYAPQAHFKDPFNDVVGVAAIERVFRHMFEQVDAPSFVVHDVVADDEQAFMRWDFRFAAQGLGGGGQTIRGVTHFRFGSDGRVVEHRDYWDAAEELYAKLPLVGALMRWLRRRLAS